MEKLTVMIKLSNFGRRKGEEKIKQSKINLVFLRKWTDIVSSWKIEKWRYKHT